MTSRWYHERQRDQYYKLAKRSGYRSRATYKLLQANQTYHFIRAGDIVADFGCAPGGWSQLAVESVGPRGKVIGVDAKPIESLLSTNFTFIQSDLADGTLPTRILELAGGSPNVVLCDAAPNIIGAWEVDHERQIDLARSALQISKTILSPNGTLFVKLFDGPLVREYLSELSLHFRDVRVVKPLASKSKSSELYALARGFKK